MKLIKDKKHTNLYRIKWTDETVSVNTPYPDKLDGHYGFYNITWANEHIKRLEGKEVLLDQTYDSPRARNKARGCVKIHFR